jgi:hypothetical protein
MTKGINSKKIMQGKTIKFILTVLIILLQIHVPFSLDGTR